MCHSTYETHFSKSHLPSHRHFSVYQIVLSRISESHIKHVVREQPVVQKVLKLNPNLANPNPQPRTLNTNPNTNPNINPNTNPNINPNRKPNPLTLTSNTNPKP